MALAYARSMAPDVQAVTADPDADGRALERLADWVLRYTPWAARWDVDNGRAQGCPVDHALMLDITGCAHLFGGEAALLADASRRLTAAGIEARLAIADTPGAAWAWAQFGATANTARAVMPPQTTRKMTAPLPVAALRIDAATAGELERLGLRTVGDVIELPRAPLAARFGRRIAERIDQLLGRSHEPISPRQPLPVWQARLAFPEPIVHRDAVTIALDHLLTSLCGMLDREHQGARALALLLYRVDGTAHRTEIATGRATRSPKHLARLFAEKLDAIDAGFGIETAVLAATRVDPQSHDQLDLDGAGRGENYGDGDAAEVIDCLKNRLGADRVVVARPRESHIPERAVTLAPSAPDARWPAGLIRPLTLLPLPEPIEAMALAPDGPPMTFTWRRAAHRVTQAEGPERIEPEWWRAEEIAPIHRRARDYYRVEDAVGRRYWIFREGLYDGAGAPPRWYMHGLFG